MDERRSYREICRGWIRSPSLVKVIIRLALFIVGGFIGNVIGFNFGNFVRTFVNSDRIVNVIGLAGGIVLFAVTFFTFRRFLLALSKYLDNFPSETSSKDQIGGRRVEWHLEFLLLRLMFQRGDAMGDVLEEMELMLRAGVPRQDRAKYLRSQVFEEFWGLLYRVRYFPAKVWESIVGR